MAYIIRLKINKNETSAFKKICHDFLVLVYVNQFIRLNLIPAIQVRSSKSTHAHNLKSGKNKHENSVAIRNAFLEYI